MQSENGRCLDSIDICSDGGVCHRTRKVTGGFAIVCTDSRGDTCRKAAGWRVGSIMGQETAPPQESSFPELVACHVAQSAVRHILDGEGVDDTPGDIVVPRNEANFESIPVRAWLDNRSVVDVARQSLCQKSSHQNPINMGRLHLRHNNKHIEWTKGHTENNSLEADLNREADACCTGAHADELSFVWPSERRCRRSHTRAVVIGDGIEAEAKATKPLRRLTACQVTRRVTQSLYPISRITIGSNAQMGCSVALPKGRHDLQRQQPCW